MMTKLMKQLQQWADEGAYQFPCEESPNGDIDVNGEGWAILDDLQSSFRSFGCLFDYVHRVLDGTIPVWRPVEHYKPVTGMRGLALIGAEVFSGVFVSFPITDQVWFMKDNTEVWLQNITHWQPLPQFIHEEKETK